MRPLRSLAVLSLALLASTGCKRWGFPQKPANYREFAYITNGGSNTVSILDLVYLRQDRVLQVGRNPSGVTANPKRNEVYVVNSGDGTITVINAETNQIVSTIGVHHKPQSISVDADGRMAYVANSGSNSVSIIDLDKRREIAAVGAGEEPGLARVSADKRTLIVTNRASGSISIYDLSPAPEEDSDTYTPPKLRSTFNNCAGATDAVILPNSSKVFVACSGSHQVLAVSLASSPGSWEAKQDPESMTDHMLALLDVGTTPVQLAMKPDGGEIFASNFDSNSISEISTSTNEVGITFPIGPKPVRGIVSADNSTLWVSTFGGDAVSIYAIDDGHLQNVIRTGPAPDAIAFSADEHLLLTANTTSGDVSVIRTEGRDGPGVFTMLPAGSKPNSIAIKSFSVK